MKKKHKVFNYQVKIKLLLDILVIFIKNTVLDIHSICILTEYLFIYPYS